MEITGGNCVLMLNMFLEQILEIFLKAFLGKSKDFGNWGTARAIMEASMEESVKILEKKSLVNSINEFLKLFLEGS